MKAKEYIRRVTSRHLTIIAANDFKCFYCRSKADHADHIVPKARGGSDGFENLIAACARCNQSKGVRRLTADRQAAALAHAAAIAEWIKETGFVGISDQFIFGFQASPEFLANVDQLRRLEKDLPNRSEMIRRVVKRAGDERRAALGNDK